MIDSATFLFGTTTTVFWSIRSRVERQPMSTTYPSVVSAIFT